MPLLVQLTPRHGRAVADPCAAAPWTSYDRLEAHVARAQLNPQVGDLLEDPIDRLSHRVTGACFIASLAGRRPLAYLLSQPLLEGRFRWPQRWDGLWARSPRFRRMWRVSSVLWGVGTLTDAALRVVTAYTLSPDLVPARGTALGPTTRRRSARRSGGLFAGTSQLQFRLRLRCRPPPCARKITVPVTAIKAKRARR